MQDEQRKKLSREFLCFAETLYLSFDESLPKYANKFSPKKFTCAQIRTLIWLRKYLQIENTLIAMEPDDAREFSVQGKSAKEWINLLHQVGVKGPSSFREVVSLVRDSPELRRILELKTLPNYSTLFRVAARFEASEPD